MIYYSSDDKVVELINELKFISSSKLNLNAGKLNVMASIQKLERHEVVKILNLCV